jgi:hypothetical protein
MTMSNVDSSGSAITPGFDPNGINWLAQQNGGSFDPILFGDYRESQDAVVTQDFGSFFNDAFPLPDLGSPLHNFNELAPEPAQPAPKADLIKQVDKAMEAEEEVVPGEDRAKMMTCNKIWSVKLALYFLLLTKILTGTACSRWRSSETERLMLTTFAASSVPKQNVLKVVLSSMRRTSTRSLLWLSSPKVKSQFDATKSMMWQ